jgi:two-component system, NarL family, invasion response regulator UvrY
MRPTLPWRAERDNDAPAATAVNARSPETGRRIEGVTRVIRILIADDHAILRRGLKEILMRELDSVTWGEAENGHQVLERVHDHDWDLLILDITMPGRSGLDVLRNLKMLRPKLPVLVLSMHPEDQYGKRVLRAGASGYMAKESAPEELIKAVRKLLGGGRYVSPALAETLALELSQDGGRPLHESLSDREFEVLRKIASGKTVGQIAEELHLGVPTVSTYRARILEKMSMSTTAELMHYALSNHLVD